MSDKVWCVSAQKNELPTAEQWMRHACAIFDRVIVVDTGSTDGTREVYELLRSEGLPITIFDWSYGVIKPFNWEAHDYVLRWGFSTAITVLREEPEWCDFSDGDEWVEFTYDSLREALATVPAGFAPAKTLHNFIPTPDGFRAQTKPQDQVKSMAHWRNGRCWPLVSAHRVRAQGAASEMPFVRIGQYAHVTIRSAEQAIVKVAQQYPQYESVRNMIRDAHYDPALIDPKHIAQWYYSGNDEVDPDSRVPFEGIEIHYQQYQKANMLEALAGLARVNLDEVRGKYGDDGIAERLADMSYAAFDRFRELMWSEAALADPATA